LYGPLRCSGVEKRSAGVEGLGKASAAYTDRHPKLVPHPPTNVDVESSGAARRPPIRTQAHAGGCATPTVFTVHPKEVAMQTRLDIGVDVSSKTVVAACAAGSFAPRTLRNEAIELRGWLKRLPEGTRIGVEATGSYHQLVADLAHAVGLAVYVLNPRDVKKYAEGVRMCR
jgi:Transposase